MNWREFFYFQKSDRMVMVVALTVAVLAFLLIFLVGEKHPTTGVDDNDSLLASTGQGYENGPDKYYSPNAEPVAAERFLFDPNTADSTQLLRLGLQPWQVRNIYRYRAKGGVFRQPTDFARVYGLTVRQYRELEPYIRIADDFRPASEVYGRRDSRESYPRYTPGTSSTDAPSVAPRAEVPRDTLQFPYKLKAGETIEVNTADTTRLKKVPGIGSGYARAILRYRERLGGFYDAGQLLEVEGFPSEALSYITVAPSHIRKLNLNKLTLNELRRHPYINFYQAKAITDYRRLKGNLHSLSDLQLLPEFPAAQLQRLEPYVEF